MEEALESAVERGDQDALTDILYPLTQTELRAGRWSEAMDRAEECWEAATWSGLRVSRMDALQARALLAAHLGRLEDAERDVKEAAQIGIAKGPPAHHFGIGLLGFLALSRGDAAETHRILGPLVESADAYGIREPALMPFLPDEVEALVALGDLEEAELLIQPFERRARRLDRVWAIAASARCRALMAAARGESSTARRHLDTATSAHDRLAQPFELGRTLLVMGSVQRRAKQRGAARESLHRAVSIFDELGASLWSARAHAELGRIGGRAQGGRDLTPTERRIAELVASGQTNREVAATTFVTIKTVEANLRRVYQKLGVRSRTELARELLSAPSDDGERRPAASKP